jgi:hypothetical protein
VSKKKDIKTYLQMLYKFSKCYIYEYLEKLKNYYSSDSIYGIRNNLAYYKQLRDLLDAHKTKAASIEFRKKVLDNQKKNNYQMEYDRIRNFLYSTNVTPQTKEIIDRRKKELESLGARAINFIYK